MYPHRYLTTIESHAITKLSNVKCLKSLHNGNYVCQKYDMIRVIGRDYYENSSNYSVSGY